MSKNDNWTTPKKLFDKFNRQVTFNLDAAASKENALCKRYLTKEDDALLYAPKVKDRIFCNPPYSLAKEFAEKFLHPTVHCVMLLPVRSDREWFQTMIHNPDFRLRWITGRLHFGGSGKGAFMYSIIVISGFKDVDMGRHRSAFIDASQFNDNGKGGAKS